MSYEPHNPISKDLLIITGEKEGIKLKLLNQMQEMRKIYDRLEKQLEDNENLIGTEYETAWFPEKSASVELYLVDYIKAQREIHDFHEKLAENVTKTWDEGFKERVAKLKEKGIHMRAEGIKYDR